MKKFISLILAVLMFACAFAGCSSQTDDDEHKHAEEEIVTADAVIKDSDAIHFMQEAYTPEELGLAEVKDEYRFMVSTNGVIYNDEKYIKVVANVVTEKEGVTAEDGSKTFSLNAVGEYLISFDGKKVLMKNMDTADEYTELESRVTDYSGKEGATAE